MAADEGPSAGQQLRDAQDDDAEQPDEEPDGEEGEEDPEGDTQ